MHLDEFDQNGFAIIPSVFTKSELEKLFVDLPNLGHAAGSRNLLTIRSFRNLAVDPRLTDIVREIHGGPGWPVRGIYFDKSPDSNWNLGWHQDTTIAVREKHEVKGYTAWSTKEGILHCRPPEIILQSMVALRVSLDECHSQNGPLRVIPGSHLFGTLTADRVSDMERCEHVECHAQVGDVVAMHPLVLHSSGKATSPDHRRVIHFEYATANIEPPLQWAFN